MMEKSGGISLTEYEKKIILGQVKLEKKASDDDPRVPDRFKGWYSYEELKEHV